MELLYSSGNDSIYQQYQVPHDWILGVNNQVADNIQGMIFMRAIFSQRHL